MAAEGILVQWRRGLGKGRHGFEGSLKKADLDVRLASAGLHYAPSDATCGLLARRSQPMPVIGWD